MAAANATQTWLPGSFSQLLTLAGRPGKAEYGGGFLMTADDQRLSQLVEQKHSPDGRQLDVRPLLHLVEDIFARATQTVNLGNEGEAQGALTISTGSSTFSIIGTGNVSTGTNTAPPPADLALTMERVSCEMGCKCLGGGTDAHEATLSVLTLLAHYPWEAKLVVTLAAFSVNYGEFLLLSQVHSTNPLAQSMALLKQLPSILDGDNINGLKRQLYAVGGLITHMLNVTKLVVEFSELPSEYVSPDEPSVKAVINHLPLTVYWIIRSTVAAATHISFIATTSHDQFMPSTTELELSNWSGKLKLFSDFLGKMKISVQKIIDAKLEEEAYNRVWRIIFKMVHQDNMTVIKTLIYSKDDVLPLFDGATNKRIQLDVLQGKTVLLLLTSLDVDPDELTVLEDIYNEPKTNEYTIVWVPVVDRSITWTDSMQAQFDSLQNTMPWYSVYHPSIIGSAVIRFFNQGLNFNGKPTLVSLDTQGKITSMNALHMMWIWKNNAFPFTTLREEALWKQETLRLELLINNNIDQTVSDWVNEDKYIFLYGGEDIDWIRKFIKVAKDVAESAKIDLGLVYVGKSCKRETVRKINAIMEADKLGHYIKDITKMCFFWTRLESMLNSKIQLEMVDDGNDKVAQEIKKIISYDKNAGGWAVICKGSKVFSSVSGTTIYDVLLKYDEWKAQVDQVGGEFHTAMLETIVAGGPENTCFRFEFPTSGGKIPEAMKCPECQNRMQNYITFVCCHDDAPVAAVGPKTRASRIAI